MRRWKNGAALNMCLVEWNVVSNFGTEFCWVKVPSLFFFHRVAVEVLFFLLAPLVGIISIWTLEVVPSWNAGIGNRDRLGPSRSGKRILAFGIWAYSVYSRIII